MKVTQSTIQFLFTCVICFVLSCKDNPVDSDLPFEAGPILFVSDKSGTWQLYSMNEDGSDVKQLTRDPNFPLTDARWSPDGSKIAITSPVGGVERYGDAIYVMSADGTGRYLLTRPSVQVDDSAYGKITYAGGSYPVWSPDSKRIAFSRMMVPEAIANLDIFVIDSDGMNETRSTKTINVSEQVTGWSPDGTLFLGTVINWAQENSRPFVALISIKGKIYRHITTDSVNSAGGIWSPDQKYIVFTSWGSMRHELFISDSDGTNKSIIPTTSNTFNYAVDWSPDGATILFNSGGRIFLTNKNGSNLKDITPKELSNTRAVSWRKR
jgi:Tol biopolymer transport system component